MTNQNLEAKPQLFTINQFVERHQFASNGGLRHLIFHASTNGFNRVIKRIGRRVLIDENQFFAWVEEKNMGGQNAR